MPVLFRKSWLRAVLLGCWVALAAGCEQHGNDLSDTQQKQALESQKDAEEWKTHIQTQDAGIGDLGGQPVRLPGYVRLLEYDDSPGFDVEKLRTYDPPKRTFASPIMSFGYDYNHETNQPKDYWTNSEQYAADQQKPGHPWVSVSVSSGRMYLAYDTVWDDTFYYELDPSRPHPYYYIELPEKQFGLDVYIPPGIDSKTKQPWRQHNDANDMFIYRDPQGHIRTEIKCSNRASIPNPPCTHRFIMTNDMKAIISLLYSRQNLPYWRKIERQVEARLRSFIVHPADEQEVSSINNQH